MQNNTQIAPLDAPICSASLAREIATLENQLKPLLDRMATLRRKERDTLSREFIAANRITREDVEMSSGDGKEWFGTAYEFGKWIAANSKKLWAEWNGRIYHAADLVNGRMPDMPGEVDHLPNAGSDARRAGLPNQQDG
jgi:hypothetical protein